LQHKVTYTTTMAGARVTCMALETFGTDEVSCLQELHGELEI
jgi:carbamoyl-phosphate synthase large subunit